MSSEDDSCRPSSCVQSPPLVQTPKAQFLSSLKNSIIIFSTALVVLVAFRNTLTWHLQRFWGASGDFWQSQWDKIYDFCGRDPFVAGVYGSFFITTSVYWIIGGLYTVMDLTGKPTFLMKYRIQDVSYPIEPSRLKQVVLTVFFNQLFVTVPFQLVVYPLAQKRGCGFQELPTFHWFLLELAVFVLMEEIGFYYSHRLLHHPRLYKYFHKQHHEWTAPIAITAIYCHPVEYLFSNLIPLFLGPFLMGSHVASFWIWYVIAIFTTLNAHSGFHFPFFPSSEGHDYHHLKFNQNFGLLGILDTIHGTNTTFRNSVLYQRHITFTSLRYTIKELYPEVKNKKSS